MKKQNLVLSGLPVLEMENKKQRNIEKSKNGSMCLVMAGLVGVAAMFGVGCDTPTDSAPQPKLCDCIEKVHGNAPCDCGGVDCTCKQKDYTLAYDIPLEDALGLVTDSNIALINEIFSSVSEGTRNILISKGLKIIVIQGSSTSRNNGEISVGIDNWEAKDKLIDALNPHVTDLYNEVVYTNNSNIHLANRRTVNVAEFAMLYKQFSTAKETVRKAFHRQGRQT